MTPRAIVIWVAATAAAGTTVATAWVQLGGAIPASQLYVATEIDKRLTPIEYLNKKQTKESAKFGRRIYSNEVKNLLIQPVPQNLEQREIWRELLEDARREQKYYIDKEIDLRKK